jgi:hypothetical protein
MYWDIATPMAGMTGMSIRRSPRDAREQQLSKAAKLWMMTALVVVSVVISTLHEAAVAFAG